MGSFIRLGRKAMSKLNEKRLAFVDIESTGLNPDKHEIIEIAVLIYNQEKNEVEKEWETKITPYHIETADNKALQISGYINNPNIYRTNLKSALIKFNSIVKGCIIVGQNISFDLRFISKNMEEANIKPSYDLRYLDLMSLSWFHVKDTDIKGISLEKLCNHFGILNVGAHSALIDCRRTFGVYQKIQKILANEDATPGIEADSDSSNNRKNINARF